MTSDQQIELRIKCDPKKIVQQPEPVKQEDQVKKMEEAEQPEQDEQAKKPEAAEQLKQAKLVDVLNVFFKNDVKLTNESVVALFAAFVEYKRYYTMLRLNTGYDGDYISSYCALFRKLDEDDVLCDLDNDLPKTIEQQIEEIGSDLNQVETQERNGDYRAIVLPDLSHKTTVPNVQWTALTSKPVILPKDVDLFLQQLGINEDDIKLDTEKWSNEAKVTLRNISIYGTRLLLDLNESLRNRADSKKVREIDAKLQGIIQFLKTVLTQKDINNAESKQEIQTAFETFEKNDKNRGTGLYQVYASIKAKKYTDEDGNEIAVKSTAGELVYDFMQAIYPADKQQKEEAKKQAQQAKAAPAKKPVEPQPEKSTSIPMTFATEGSGEDTVAILYIDNREGKIKVEDLEAWFKNNDYDRPNYKVTSNKQIELRIRCEAEVADEKLKQTDKAELTKKAEQIKKAKQANLGQVLKLLDIKDIKLTDDSCRALEANFTEFAWDFIFSYFNLGIDVEFQSSRSAYLQTFDGVESYLRANTSDIIKQEFKVSESNFKKTRMFQSEDSRFKGMFPDLKSTTVKSKWTALSAKPDISILDACNFMNQLNIEGKIKLKTKNLPDEKKMVLRNISLYGAKLLADLDNALRNKADPKKVKELEAKIKGVNQFLTTVLSQKDLNNPESITAIRNAYVAFETNDKNRGTGLYSFFARVSGKTFKDDKGVERAIQSTTGELLHDFMEALYPTVDLQKKDPEGEKAPVVKV